MKKITLLMSLLFTTIGFSQTLPFDFSTANHLMAGVGGATSTLEQEGTNDVLQIVGATQPYDHARADFASPLDLSDNANNTLTFEIKPVNGTGSGSHLVKFESGAGQPVTELFFTTTGTDWQTITLNFGSNLGSFASMILFIDFGDSNASFSDTYLVDDISVGADPAATCDDGIQNGDETGIDCGGPACDACPVVTLPLDFSDASQLFTHDGAGAGGSVVLENGKLRFNGNGQAYDQAYLDLTETFSTIDSDNNTFTVRMEPLLVPAGEERTHLLKVSIGTGAAIEIPGKSIGSDEQDVTFNFGITGAENWNRITIFMDFGPDGANTYNAKVTDYLISSITLGEDPPEVVPTNAATAPIAREAGDVISIFSDAYTDVALGEVDPDWSPATVETITIDGDNIWKLTGCDFFSVTQYAGIDFSEMEMMHIDFFTPDAAGLAVGVKLVDTVTSANEIISLGNTVSGAWTSVDVDLSTVSMDISNITQILYDPSSEGQTHYIDNFYFYRAATATVEDFAVNSVKMYPNPAKGFVNFSSASNEALDVAVYDMLGKEVLRANAVQSQLNISSLNPGMYFVNMTQGSNVSTKKLLVN
jgi:hypothetical protein